MSRKIYSGITVVPDVKLRLVQLQPDLIKNLKLYNYNNVESSFQLT